MSFFSRNLRHLIFIAVGLNLASLLLAADITQWTPLPLSSTFKERSEHSVTLTGNTWNYLVTPANLEDVGISAKIRMVKPASRFDFFGASWSAWPDPKFEDRGFEAGLLLRGSADGKSGYRIQVSSKYQEITLVRFPEGGYLRSVHISVDPSQTIHLQAIIAGNVLRVFIDDRQVIEYADRLETPLTSNLLGVGASSGAEVQFSEILITPATELTPLAPSIHQPSFTTRPWLGGRLFVFDHDEPILQLHHQADPSCFAKLMPGDKPRLTFDSHWGLENQGAFPEAKVAWTDPQVSGQGKFVKVAWSAMHLQKRFKTESELLVGYDTNRGTYTYDIDSELEVLPGEPFHFRYGFDFEHHTPLDPFRWQYLLIRDSQGKMRYRPLSPFDPGILADIDSQTGLRVWHGRTGEPQRVAPAVEYHNSKEWNIQSNTAASTSPRQLNTAVCAAFYDTGVSFEPTTAKPGDRVRVRYRYTGYPSEETSQLFANSIVQENPRIDPYHHFVFAGSQWPTIGFEDALALDKPWWGNRPFLSGHNLRPTYDWVSTEQGRALRLGPISYALAPIGPEKIEPGKYRVSAKVKAHNTFGPGGRIEILSLKKSDLQGNGFLRMDPSNILAEEIRYFGNGSFDWKTCDFFVTVPTDATGLALGLGNAGTGEVLVSSITIAPHSSDQNVSDTLATIPPNDLALPNSVWDLRMTEQQGQYLYNYGISNHRVLELNNVDWSKPDGFTTLQFAENAQDRADYPLLGILDNWLRNPAQKANYEPVRHVASALGGGPHEQRDFSDGITLAAWVKPSAEMGKSQHGGKGDIVGYGARKFILSLIGQSSPYTLQARINVNDRIDSNIPIDANRWYHVAMTCKPQATGWQVVLFLDGKQIAAGLSKMPPQETKITDSIVLGAELYYLHDAYYRGEMGRVVVLNKSLEATEIEKLATRTPSPNP